MGLRWKQNIICCWQTSSVIWSQFFFQTMFSIVDWTNQKANIFFLIVVCCDALSLSSSLNNFVDCWFLFLDNNRSLPFHHQHPRCSTSLPYKMRASLDSWLKSSIEHEPFLLRQFMFMFNCHWDRTIKNDRWVSEWFFRSFFVYYLFYFSSSRWKQMERKCWHKLSLKKNRIICLVYDYKRVIVFPWLSPHYVHHPHLQLVYSR